MSQFIERLSDALPPSNANAYQGPTVIDKSDSTVESPKQERMLILLLALIQFVHILDFVIVMPLGDQLRDELQFSPRQFSEVVSAYGLAATIAGVLAALVVDRLNRRHVMLAMFAGFVVATFACGLSSTYWTLLLARGAAGVFGGVVSSTVMAFVVDLIPEVRRGRALGAVTSSFAVASTVGLPIGLGLANYFHRFGAPFLAIAAVSLLVWMGIYMFLPNLTQQRTVETRRALHQFRIVATDANHIASFALMLTMILGTFMIVPFIAPYLEANCGIRRDQIALIYFVAGIATFISTNLVGRIVDLFGPLRVFVSAAVATIVMVYVLVLAPVHGVVLAVLVVTCFMVGSSSRMIPAQAMMLRSARVETRGAFTSLNTAVAHCATGFGPILSGFIIGEEYPGGPLTNIVIAGALSTAVMAFTILFAIILSRRATDSQA